MKAMIAALVAALMASVASADSFSTLRTAVALGDLIGSEKPCGLHYKQDAIKRFIAKNVPASDMNFPNQMQLYTEYASGNFSGMSRSEKTAQCFQIERAAQANGLLPSK